MLIKTIILSQNYNNINPTDLCFSIFRAIAYDHLLINNDHVIVFILLIISAYFISLLLEEVKQTFQNKSHRVFCPRL